MDMIEGDAQSIPERVHRSSISAGISGISGILS